MSKRQLRLIDSSDPPLAKGARDPSKNWEPVLDPASLPAWRPNWNAEKSLATLDQNWSDGSERYGQDETTGLLSDIEARARAIFRPIPAAIGALCRVAPFGPPHVQKLGWVTPNENRCSTTSYTGLRQLLRSWRAGKIPVGHEAALIAAPHDLGPRITICG